MGDSFMHWESLYSVTFVISCDYVQGNWEGTNHLFWWEIGTGKSGLLGKKTNHLFCWERKPWQNVKGTHANFPIKCTKRTEIHENSGNLCVEMLLGNFPTNGEFCWEMFPMNMKKNRWFVRFPNLLGNWMGTFPNKTAEKTNELSKIGYFVNEFERTNTNKRAKMDFGEICWGKRTNHLFWWENWWELFPTKKEVCHNKSGRGGGATDRRTMGPGVADWVGVRGPLIRRQRETPWKRSSKLRLLKRSLSSRGFGNAAGPRAARR